MSETLSHLDEEGRARMVDVSGKPATRRTAIAEGTVAMSPEAYEAARSGNLPKGDLLSVARIAGIMAAKETPRLIPLCHPIALRHVEVTFRWDDGKRSLGIRTSASAEDATGVEMEALTACAVACLSVYDMVKALDKGSVVGPIRLVEKTGGKSGKYGR